MLVEERVLSHFSVLLHSLLRIYVQLVAFVHRVPQYFRRHDEAGSLRSDLHVPSEQAHIVVAKRLTKLAKLLIGEGFDWRCVDCPEGREAYTLLISQVTDKYEIHSLIFYGHFCTANGV